MGTNVMFGGLEMTQAAARNAEEAGCDPSEDIEAFRAGAWTPETFLAHCLDGADEDRAQGWREYADAVVGTLPWRVHLVASNPSEGDRHGDPDASARLLSLQPTKEDARAAARRHLALAPDAWVQIQEGPDGAAEDVRVAS